jgi:hypothetical protein
MPGGSESALLAPRSGAGHPPLPSRRGACPTSPPRSAADHRSAPSARSMRRCRHRASRAETRERRHGCARHGCAAAWLRGGMAAHCNGCLRDGCELRRRLLARPFAASHGSNTRCATAAISRCERHVERMPLRAAHAARAFLQPSRATSRKVNRHAASTEPFRDVQVSPRGSHAGNLAARWHRLLPLQSLL